MIDYEQKYKESLSRAKRCYEGNSIYVLPKKDLEYIFPELKESEDERIRKNCIHFLELQKEHHAATFEIEECVSWLEKQKLIKWTNDDKDNINGIINYLCQSDAVTLDGFDEWYDWLKSLKERINYKNNL